jgi:predicted NAD/FAD-binding protein
MLRDLDVKLNSTNISLSYSHNQSKHEWGSNSLMGLYNSGRNLSRPRTWRMLFDITRFELNAPDFLRKKDSDCLRYSVRDYLLFYGYSNAFRDEYLLPLCAAIWHAPEQVVLLDMPAYTVIRTLWNHDLLVTLRQRIP